MHTPLKPDQHTTKQRKRIAILIGIGMVALFLIEFYIISKIH